MNTLTRIVCSGCGAEVDDSRSSAFQCPRFSRSSDVDHLLARVFEPAPPSFPKRGEPNPFLRYRDFFHARHLGRAGGVDDDELDDMIRRADERCAELDGQGFVQTPFERSKALSRALGFRAEGGVWLKDETENVSGSHKGRHLFGILHYLDVRERLELDSPSARPKLAIASCGNAALAAAVIAKAGNRHLDIFVPESAEKVTIDHLRELEASVRVCARKPGTRGDPSIEHLREAIARGAVPFTCQGNQNGLTIEGGETIAYEIVAKGGPRLDRLFVPVGGGALASACVAALREARTAGAIESLPRIHAVQTQGGHPLARAYSLVVERILDRLDREQGECLPSDPKRLADPLRERYHTPQVQEVLRYAATHRSEFMWPWEETPVSLAEGILDDETYDWYAVVTGMLESGGYPVVVSEAELRAANELVLDQAARPVSFTGSASVAGLAHLAEGGGITPSESVAVLLTGRRRG